MRLSNPISARFLIRQLNRLTALLQCFILGHMIPVLWKYLRSIYIKDAFCVFVLATAPSQMLFFYNVLFKVRIPQNLLVDSLHVSAFALCLVTMIKLQSIRGFSLSFSNLRLTVLLELMFIILFWGIRDLVMLMHIEGAGSQRILSDPKLPAFIFVTAAINFFVSALLSCLEEDAFEIEGSGFNNEIDAFSNEKDALHIEINACKPVHKTAVGLSSDTEVYIAVFRWMLGPVIVASVLTVITWYMTGYDPLGIFSFWISIAYAVKDKAAPFKKKHTRH